MLQGVAALKLKGNLYFPSSRQTQSNKHNILCPIQHLT